jgi:ABC-type Fe3+-hydroxamate transport system substrate-binding protein
VSAVRGALAGGFLALLGLVAACGRTAVERPDGRWGHVEGSGAARRLVHVDGRVEPLPPAPRRIVSALPNLTELVAHLGGVERLAGVSEHCNFPPEVLALPKVSVLPVDAEGLRQLAPDLVLCDPVFHAASLDLLERQRLPLATLESRSLDHLATTIRVLGEILDTAQARERAAALVARLAQARERVRRPDAGDPPRVLVVGQADPLHVLGPGSLFDDMLRACGAVNVAADLGRPSAPFSEEALLVRRPTWILTTWQPLPDAQRKRWARVPAVVEGHVALAAADDLLRAGPRTPEALERLADVLAGRLPPERLSEPR